MSRARIAALDGVRAYAVTLVFLVHFLAHYFNGVTSARRIDFDTLQLAAAASWSEAAAKYLWASHYGVDVFFLLSGYLILRIISRPEFSYFGFLKNRFLRLYPAFIFAVAVHLAYMAKFWNKTFDPSTIVANLALLHGIWELGIPAIIVPTWSLTFEWLFYLAFPLVLLLTGARQRVTWRHLGFAALALLLLIPVGPHYTRFLMFLLGAALAIVPAASIRGAVARVPNTAAIGLYLAVNLIFAFDQNWYLFIPFYLCTSGLIVAKILCGTGGFFKVLSWPALSRLGVVSYSFYLFHGLAIVAFCDHVGPYLRVPEAMRFAILISGSFAASLAIAQLSYLLLEKPYFDRARKQRQTECGKAAAVTFCYIKQV